MSRFIPLLQQKLEMLTKEKQELEQLQTQLRTLKDSAEKQEHEATELHPGFDSTSLLLCVFMIVFQNTIS